MANSHTRRHSPQPQTTDGACLVSTATSPNARLQSAPVDAVRWTTGFWANRFQTTREVTVKRLWELLADPDAGHVLENFRIAAGQADGDHEGTNWQDEWLYKWIEAAACLYRLTGDEWLDRRMDEAIGLVAAAQESDGYVATQITVPGKPRFQDPRDHEVYNMGHLLTAAVVHRRMTGKDSLLAVARRVGDFLAATLGVSVEPSFAHNPSAIMGLTELHRETGENRYLDCAQRIVDARGSKPLPRPYDIWHRPHGIAGTDQIQDRVPLRQSTEVVGHNVFFTYLFAGAADVYLETGDDTLKQALDRLWTDLATRKVNVNGGVSPMGLGLSSHRDIVNEAVGAPYFLPNASSYNETCGQIGALLWNHRMLLADPQTRYADQIEWLIYNGILSGIGLDGASWWYRNPLRRHDARHEGSGLNDLAQRELPGEARICCPSNLLRTVAEFQTYLFSTDADGVWLHQYGACTADLPLPAGDRMVLTEETDYPWDGRIILTVRHAPPRAVAMRLRIPAWADGATVRVNGQPIGEAVQPGHYARCERQWTAGDQLELDVPMPARLLEANPRVEHCRNQVAVARGPILYCAESPDLPPSCDLDGLLLPTDIDLQPAPAPDLGVGVIALEGQALCRPKADWTGQLYRSLATSQPQPTPVRLIPYYAWANRGPSAMSVWLPVAFRG